MVQVQQFGTGARYGLDILHNSGKSVETKSQKICGTSSDICRSYKGNTSRVTFFLNRINEVEAFVTIGICIQMQIYIFSKIIPLMISNFKKESLLLSLVESAKPIKSSIKCFSKILII